MAGLGARFDGTYRLTQTTHAIGGCGLHDHLPGPQGGARWLTCRRRSALGRVIEVEISDAKGLRASCQRLDRPDGDRDRLGRGGEPSMAAPRGGMLFAPEVGRPRGDRLLRRSARSSSASSTAARTDAPPRRSSERRIKSRDRNMIVLFDGEKSGITIEDASGNQIVMNADGITIKTNGRADARGLRHHRRSRAPRWS